MSNASVFTDAEIEQFIERGYVKLERAFDPQVAERARAYLWKKLGLDPNDPSTWTKSLIHLQESYNDEDPWGRVTTPRVCAAYDQLLGDGTYKMPGNFGWWPVSFPGFATGPWQTPTTGWHVDGIHFHHHIHSPNQALLSIYLFSDIAPGGGGTALDIGSHKITARILADAEPGGLAINDLCQRVNEYPLGEVIEATGQAGDIYLMHPFMRHARSMNTGKSVRFICNPCASFHQPMNLHREREADYCPVELAIVRALNAQPTDR